MPDENGRGEKAAATVPASPESKILDRSVVDVPASAQIVPTDQNFLIWLGSVAESIVPWGTSPKARDKQLRAFFPTESYLLSGLGTICARNAAFAWKLEGPEQSVAVAQDMIVNANRGKGWQDWAIRESIDLYTQDIGAWVEVIHSEPDNPNSPVVNFAHLDAGRCYPTGDPDIPLLYLDRLGRFHELKWWQCEQLTEMPAPIEGFGGALYTVQFCAVTRLLRAAQILKSVAIYQDEKLSGRSERAIHLIRGIDVKKIEDALTQTRMVADAQGYSRYIRPAMVGSHNPDADVGHDTIELAGLPDGFDQEVVMKWYIDILALAFNSDYQDFAPLPGGGLGTSNQSQVLHAKSRGKGPAMWQAIITHFINYSGILPKNVKFSFDEQDLQAEAEETTIKFQRAQSRAAQIASAEIDPEAARRLALDAGDITQEIYDDLEQRQKENQAKQEAFMKAANQAQAAQQQQQQQPGGASTTAQQQQGQDAQQSGDQPAPGNNAARTKARIPPGRIALEEEVVDPFDEIMGDIHAKVVARLRRLDRPTPLEADKAAYEPPRKPRRLLRRVVEWNKGRPAATIEQEV